MINDQNNISFIIHEVLFYMYMYSSSLVQIGRTHEALYH